MDKIAEALLAEFPGWDSDEARALAKMFIEAVRRHDPLKNKSTKVVITGPKRNLVYISSELRKAREAVLPKLTQDKVSELTEWSPSKIIRIEAGQSAPSKPDIMFLGEIYGLSKERIAHLISKRLG